MNEYVNHKDNFKVSQIFVYLQDIEMTYKLYKEKQIDKAESIYRISRLFSYLKGFLYGLEVKHVIKYFFNDGVKYEYLSFYNSSSKDTKYTLCLCLVPDHFCVKYTISDKRGVKNVRK